LQPRTFSHTSRFSGLAQRFIDKITTFDDLYVSYRKHVADKARLYLFGIARNGIRKIMSQIAHRLWKRLAGAVFEVVAVPRNLTFSQFKV
jgi:predicted exporter